MNLPICNAEIIKTFIPHREPIIMVDALYKYAEKQVVGGLTVEENNLFNKNGHLAEPGLIEHMAQTVALHTGYQYYLIGQPAPTGYIGTIKNLHINRLPKVKEKIVTEVEILQEVMGVSLVKITSNINQECIAIGEMKTVLASL
ncbi:hypothetical protein QP519_03720 [Weeksella virosa]|uniref:hypothetical protein n=1 Tax=Weeksella virosa TaxID=1014 RepID=UPI0025521F28|nr:hypothetical protein [Weeksella virosa]MDK7374643.1 hypothetical protein [Weeksella virosa]